MTIWDKFFLGIGIIVGFFSFFYIQNFFLSALENLNFTTYIDYGEEVCTQRGAGRTSWEDCDEGSGTDIAIYFGILSGVLAFGLGNMIFQRKFPPFFHNPSDKFYTRTAKQTYYTWLICSLLICVMSLLVFKVFGPDIGEYISFVITIIIIFIGYNVYQKKTKLEKNDL